MRNLAVLFIHLIAVLARLIGLGGVRSVVAESLLLKHQLLIVNRSRQRAPNLSAWDRIFAGWMALLVRPTRLLRSAIVLKPSTLLGFRARDESGLGGRRADTETPAVSDAAHSG
jgi:putative transposase